MNTKQWIVGIIALGCFSSCAFSSSPGPANSSDAKKLIEKILPVAWRVVELSSSVIDVTKEYFPDAGGQTLVLVGPEVDHIRWTDHQGNVHIEDWSKECILLWIIPSNFKPKFPDWYDRLASGGERLPSKIFSGDHVCVYSLTTNSGFNRKRFVEIAYDIAKFSIDGVNPSWKNWSKDIEKQLNTIPSPK